MPWKAWVAAVAIAGAGFAADRADAAPNVAHLSWGSQLNPSDCPDDQNYRYLEVNVTGQVSNDADQAPAGNYWARLEYNRHIQVWKVGIVVDPPPAGERYCVLVKYQGSWLTTNNAMRPGNSALTLPAGIEGTFQGGYRAIVIGVLREDGSVKLRGRAPTVDRGWSGLPYASPAQDDWIDRFFSSYTSVTPVWWGWIYHGGPNSTFVNACDLADNPECPGNSGDITP